MRTLALGLLAIAAVTLALLAHGEPVAAEPTDKEKTDMAAKVYTLLKDKCYSCHGESGYNTWGKKGTLNYILNYDKLISEKLIDTKSPEKSELYTEIKDGNMPREMNSEGKPKTKKKLAQAEIDLVLNWIKAGAPKWEAGQKETPLEFEWKELKTKGPDARGGHLMSEGPDNTVVLFGGHVGEVWKDETWIFSNGAWTMATPKTKPSSEMDGFSYAAMAFDRKRGVTVLVGALGKNWIWNGKDWKEETVAGGPMGQAGGGFAYSDSLGVLVLFGGVAMGEGEKNDTWTYDGKAWKKLDLKNAPEARAAPAMAWSPIEKALLLYGGMKDNVSLKDTWTFDGKAWKKLETAHSPTQQGTLASTPSGVLLVSYGQVNVGTWQWDGKDWNYIDEGPKARSGFGLASDTKNRRVILFGGSWDGKDFGETWSYAAVK